MSAKLVVGDAEGGGLDCEPPIGAILAPSGLGQHHLVLQATSSRLVFQLPREKPSAVEAREYGMRCGHRRDLRLVSLRGFCRTCLAITPGVSIDPANAKAVEVFPRTGFSIPEARLLSSRLPRD
jgi:hypothetical protein